MILNNRCTAWENKLFFFLFPCIFVALILFGYRPVTAFQKPVAKVNDTVLTEADLEEAFNEIMPASRFHGGLSSQKRLSYRPKAIENMIEKELFYQEAVKKDLKVEKGLIMAEKDKTIKRFGNKKKFEAALKKAGLDDKKYTAKLRKKYLVKRIITLEVENKAKVADKEVKAHYEKNKKKYMRPEARRLTHILIKVPPTAAAADRKLKRKRAQEVIDKIKAGEDMSVIAWDYSDDPYRVKGGDFGLVHKGRLDQDLEKEVFKLKPGRVSDVIETRYGYHVVRVEEIRVPEQLVLEDVAQKIKGMLSEKKEKQLRQALVEGLKAQAKIELY